MIEHIVSAVPYLWRCACGFESDPKQPIPQQRKAMIEHLTKAWKDGQLVDVAGVIDQPHA